MLFRAVMVLTVGVLVGCGDRNAVLVPVDPDPPKPPPALSPVEADLLANAIALNIDAGIDFATTSVLGFFAPPSDDFECGPTMSPLPVRNADGDRAPDSMRLTFVRCARGTLGGTDSLFGMVDLVDPDPAAAGDSVRVVFTDFVRKRWRDGLAEPFTATLNGERMQYHTGKWLTQIVRDFRTDYRFENGMAASEVRTAVTRFTSEDSIPTDATLPAGEWQFRIASSWVLGARSFIMSKHDYIPGIPANDPIQPGFVVIPPPPPPLPIRYEPSCELTPRIQRGGMGARVTSGTGSSILWLTFSQCGLYEVRLF
jgi:hypothetical protein